MLRYLLLLTSIWRPLGLRRIGVECFAIFANGRRSPPICPLVERVRDEILARGEERRGLSAKDQIRRVILTEIGVVHQITDTKALEAIYGLPSISSIKKEVNYIHPYYKALVEASPFAVLATNGPDGLDVSPRGDQAGFVHVYDEKTLLLPDRRGNNRIDSLRNIIHDPRVALIFLIPGVGETLRVNGEAKITTDPELIWRC